jgi:V/A-type H+-transporting ATPase subunit F
MDYFFIGDPELVTAFRFVGIDGVSVVNGDEAKSVFVQTTHASGARSCRILVMTEEVADWLGDDLTEWQLSDQYPLVVEVPGMIGRLPGRKTLVDSIREAIGIHV